MELSRVPMDWPGARWLVALATAVLVVLGQLAAAPRGACLPAWWWTATTATSALAGLVLASYLPVPGSGRRIEAGCTPCATLAGGLAAFAVVASLGSVALGGSLIALVLGGVALYQRLNDVGTCRSPAVTSDRPTDRPHPQDRAVRPAHRRTRERC